MPVDPRYSSVARLLESLHREDPLASAQVCAIVDGRTVVDLSIGDALGPDSLVCVYSVSKGFTGLCIALLIQRGLLDPEAPVARYWPEFAAAGKAGVTVGDALSHRAGVPFLDGLPEGAWFSDEGVAPVLAAAHPVWQPGSAFGYHAITVGVIASALVRAVTGQSVAEFWEREIRAPRDLEAWFDLPEELEPRVTEVVWPDVEQVVGDTDQIADHVFAPLASNPGLLGIANTRAGHTAGMAAASALASARGIAGAYAAVLWDGLLSPETLEVVSQIRSDGQDAVMGGRGRFGILFQRPHPERPFAGWRAIGHDGAAGAFGFADPDAGIAFGYTTERPTALGDRSPSEELAAEVRRVALALQRPPGGSDASGSA